VRLFGAVYPSPAACADLGLAVDALAVGRAAAAGTNTRLAGRPNWHLTVAFLGDVPEERLGDVRTAFDHAVSGWGKDSDAPPRLRLAGGGRFGRGRFTVLWVGVGGEVGRMAALGRTVRRQLRRARLPYDEKPMRPHLTLARPGDRLDPEAIAGDVAALNAYEGPWWTADELVLVSSHLGPKPSYDRLASWPLTP
jgi:RNA 2',3'-cyclic 3'-phosphodiesterase